MLHLLLPRSSLYLPCSLTHAKFPKVRYIRSLVLCRRFYTIMETTPRRSSRLKKLKTTREEAGLIGQQTPQVHEAGNQQSRSNKSTSKLLELPAEIRLLIFSCVVATERPYMIGRCQEERAARSTAALETYTASAQPILRCGGTTGEIGLNSPL